VRLPLNIHRRGSLANQLVLATLGSIGVRLGGMTVTFLVGVQLARYLGPAQYGVYGFVLSILAVVVVVAGLGIAPLATRELAVRIARREWPEFNGYLLWSFVVVAATSFVAALLLAGRLDLLQPAGSAPMGLQPLIAALVPALALTGLAAAALRGCGVIVGGQALDALIRPAIFSAALLAAAVLAPPVDVNEALTLHAAAAGLTLLVALFWLARSRPKEAQARPILSTGPWLKSALPMGLTDLLRAIDGNVVPILLAGMVTTTDLGVFRVAAASAALLALPYALFSVIGAPIIARLHAEADIVRLQKTASAIALAMTAATGLLLLLLWWLGPALIALLFGSAYSDAWPILMVLGVAQLFTAAFGISPTLLNATGAEKFLAMIYALSLAVTLLGTVLLTPSLGILGAAVAVVIGVVLRGIPLQIGVVRRLGIQPSILSVCQGRKLGGRAA
jgi:O-antigen/teichoic acid export membrane protein